MEDSNRQLVLSIRTLCEADHSALLAECSPQVSACASREGLNQIYQIETDVLVVIRTDSAAGQGGFGGLPKPFTTYNGRMVIADDPNTVAALTDPGGYLAIKYLDDNIVGKLATA